VLLDAVVASNPFYQAKFERSRYGHKIRDLGEFGETIPFTTEGRDRRRTSRTIRRSERN
jgi:hypothetical protein